MHNNIHYIAKGKEFPCKSLKYLKKFKLSDQFPILNISKVGKFPEDSCYCFYTITFNYSYKKIIVYDLGGLAESPEIMSELKGVCKLELRIFDKHQLPFSVRHLSSFAWKVFLIAEVFVNTSILSISTHLSTFSKFTRNTMHGIRFATHPKFYALLVPEVFCLNKVRLGVAAKYIHFLNNQVSFDVEIQKLTNYRCSLRSIDKGDISAETRKAISNANGKIIETMISSAAKEDNKTKRALSTVMSSLGDKSIEILKIDIEGGKKSRSSYVCSRHAGIFDKHVRSSVDASSIYSVEFKRGDMKIVTVILFIQPTLAY
uniref:Uncharacterized protein n=1 Tax=Ditylenchus dipsaci TaxID=166011 RepID=A0A915DNU5_9BILA